MSLSDAMFETFLCVLPCVNERAAVKIDRDSRQCQPGP